MKKVKITVLKTTFDEELAREYGVFGLGPCPMMQAGQFNQFGFLPSTNLNPYGALLGNNSNTDFAKMFLYNQMTNQQNNLLNYGI